MGTDGVPGSVGNEDHLALLRTIQLGRALRNYVDDVIGHGAAEEAYLSLLKRDLGPIGFSLLMEILNREDRLADFLDHCRRWRASRRQARLDPETRP